MFHVIICKNPGGTATMENSSTQKYLVIQIKIPMDKAANILKQVIEYLSQFMPKTLAKRLVSIVLIAVNIPVPTIEELSVASKRSLWTLHKSIKESTVAQLMETKPGRGREGKLDCIEAEIIEELETNNYHTYQEVVDMIEDQHNVQVSRSAVGRFLKKKASAGTKLARSPRKQTP